MENYQDSYIVEKILDEASRRIGRRIINVPDGMSTHTILANLASIKAKKARGRAYYSKTPEDKEKEIKRAEALETLSKKARDRAVKKPVGSPGERVHTSRREIDTPNPNREGLVGHAPEITPQERQDPTKSTHELISRSRLRRALANKNKGKPVEKGSRVPDESRAIQPKSKKAERRRAARQAAHGTPVRAGGYKEWAKENLKEVYEYILEYLIYEGYADNYEDADGIFQIMSENWFAEILEESL